MIEISRVTCLSLALLASGVGFCARSDDALQPPIPSLKSAQLFSTPPEQSPAGVARSYELRINELQRRITARKGVLMSSDDQAKSISNALNETRKELMDGIGKLSEVQTFDQQRMELLKEYAALESRFNRFRIHWTTHNKPVRRQDGSAVSEKASPLKGCPDCQKDFDRFLTNDPVLIEQYGKTAAQLLADLDLKRARLLPMTIQRAQLVSKCIQQDSKLRDLDSRIKALESQQSALWQSDEELAALNESLQKVRGEQVATVSGTSPTSTRRHAPRKRNDSHRSLALRRRVLPHKYSREIS